MDILLYCIMVRRLRRMNKAYLSILFGYLGILVIVFLLPVFSILLGATGIYYGEKYKENVMKSIEHLSPEEINRSSYIPFELRFARAGTILGETAIVWSMLYMIYVAIIAINLFS